VRLVTSVANHALGVRYGIHLGKGFRLGSVFFMAAPAEVGDIGQFGHVGDGVVHMFGQGAVACLTMYTRMLTCVMHLGFLVVADRALASASIGNGERGDHVKRTRPVVSVFSKVFGYHNGPDNQEDNHSRQQDERGTNQVSGISEKATQCHPQSEAALSSIFAVG